MVHVVHLQNEVENDESVFWQQDRFFFLGYLSFTVYDKYDLFYVYIHVLSVG